MKKMILICLSMVIISVTIMLSLNAQMQKPFFVAGEGVKFVYQLPTAKTVHLAGDFNNWNITNKPMKKNPQGTWVVIVPLAEGKYQFGFVVDGKKPVRDKSVIEIKRNESGKLYVELADEKKNGQPTAETVTPKPVDEVKKEPEQTAALTETTVEKKVVTGTTEESTTKPVEKNSVPETEYNFPLGALPPQVFENDVKFWYNAPQSKEVSIAGGFNKWSSTRDKMVKNEKGIWELIMSLKAGQYEYQYVIDGVMAGGPKWMIAVQESTSKE